MPDRRNFIKSLSSLPLLGGLLASRRALAAPRKRDYFKELGVRPIINAAGTYTALTASLMPPEVVAAWEYGSRRYARLDEVHDAVGKRIAELVGCEAAMVTAGAASALTLGTAACLTGKNVKFVRQLPDTTGMKNEVTIQKSHHFGYEHAVRNCGIRFVEVESREDVERVAGERTAMMLFLNSAEPAGQIKLAEFAELGKKHNIPTFNDCAADVPPVENLSRPLKLGFSLVAFSGGKGLCGPQSAGLLLGQRDLIAAARLNGPPNSDTIGRGMKVNKEEMLAMLAALELYTTRDHAADDVEPALLFQRVEDALERLGERAGSEIGESVRPLSGFLEDGVALQADLGFGHCSRFVGSWLRPMMRSTGVASLTACGARDPGVRAPRSGAGRGSS